MTTLNASLSVLREIHSGGFSVQSITQRTADIATILVQTLNELSLKRGVFIKSVINNEYKDLCSSSEPVTVFLFGDNLPHRRIEFDRQTWFRTNKQIQLL